MVRKKTATTSTEQTEKFKVLGNCGMCERTIESAATGAGARSAEWDADAHTLTVTFVAGQTSADQIQKAVAQSGYDNAGYKAPDTVYNALHACCHYDRSGAPSTAKACPADTPQKQ
ncbi:MAG: heavy-metal-associated domain-containing protein [Saprospiraceae bacterium]|nr:heavy-metal-associated domain-containing protein [Saprospiraceae bacterium]